MSGTPEYYFKLRWTGLDHSSGHRIWPRTHGFRSSSSSRIWWRANDLDSTCASL